MEGEVEPLADVRGDDGPGEAEGAVPLGGACVEGSGAGSGGNGCRKNSELGGDRRPCGELVTNACEVGRVGDDGHPFDGKFNRPFEGVGRVSVHAHIGRGDAPIAVEVGIHAKNFVLLADLNPELDARLGRPEHVASAGRVQVFPGLGGSVEERSKGFCVEGGESEAIKRRGHGARVPRNRCKASLRVAFPSRAAAVRATFGPNGFFRETFPSAAT